MTFDPQTLIRQLGGNRFIAMTGAHHFTSGNNTLTFRIGRNAKSINAVRITYMPSDTYRMEFCRVSVRGCRVMTVASDVYAEDLQSVFTRHTGMVTSLGTMRGAA